MNIDLRRWSLFEFPIVINRTETRMQSIKTVPAAARGH